MRRLLWLASRIMRSNLSELPRPYRLTFAVTDKCQARCSMCGIWQKPARDELSVAEIKAIFSQANRFSWINVTGGELFQRPDHMEVLQAIIEHSRDLYLLNFPTNGQQTTDIVAAVDQILEKSVLPRLMVSVSIDGPRQLHDSIRNLPGSWERALNTFRSLRQRSSRRFSVFLGLTLQEANLDALDETLDACRDALGSFSDEELHINIAHVSSHYYGNTAFPGLPDRARVAATLKRLAASRRWQFGNPVHFVERRYQKLALDYLNHGRSPVACQAAGASCFIDPQGIVYPCSGFDRPLGSLREQNYDLYRIWRSQMHQDLRLAVRSGDCPQCWTPCEAYQSLLADLVRLPGKQP